MQNLQRRKNKFVYLRYGNPYQNKEVQRFIRCASFLFIFVSKIKKNLNYFSPSAFLYGIPVGFFFSFGLGPVFFTLIQSSLQYGFRKAAYIIIGVVLADIIMLAIAYSGINAFLPDSVDVGFWAELIGGIVLLVLGISFLIKKAIETEVVIEDSKLIAQNIGKGFFLNILNPGNFMEWVAMAGILKTKYHYDTYQNVSFFTAAILMVIVTEFAIAYYASKLKGIMTVKTMDIINKVSGLIFIGFGLWFLWEAFFK
jgi:L-lysine exporter family protein LysE/ArgO